MTGTVLINKVGKNQTNKKKLARKGSGPWPNRTTAIAAHLATLLAVLVVWGLVTKTGIIRPSLSHGPVEVWNAFAWMLGEGIIWNHLWATLSATLVALALAAIIGIPIGLSLALLPKTESLASPYLSALNAMPRVALAPVFIIMFGIDTEAKVALAFTLAIFVFIINARAGGGR